MTITVLQRSLIDLIGLKEANICKALPLNFLTNLIFRCLQIGNLTGDLIEVKLQTPREIAFRYSAGSGVEVISIATPFDLNDNEWHTVRIERNRKEARLNIDSISAGNPEDLYAYRPFMFTSNLTVGGSISYNDGFVGCFRGLTINGRAVDLVRLAEQSVYGVSVGCVGKCASSPCLNNGICVEMYSSYQCDCTFTPFRGPICGTEIGTILEASNMIKYTFPAIGVVATEVRIRWLDLGFEIRILLNLFFFQLISTDVKIYSCYRNLNNISVIVCIKDKRVL